MSKTNEQKLVDRLNQDLEPGKFIQLEGKSNKHYVLECHRKK